MAVLASYQARTMMTGLENMLSFPQLLLLRLLVPFVVYFWLSRTPCAFPIRPHG
jgi:hypothetical protein